MSKQKNESKARAPRCYIYTRVSTEMQVEGYSLAAQREKLQRYAEYNEMQIVREFSDEGRSGKNTVDRPAFQDLMNKIQNREDNIDFVLVFKLSRFGRNAADVLFNLQIMQDFGVNLICVEDGIDSSKDAGKLMISVLSSVAEIERENIRVQTMEGRQQKAREGGWNGGQAPYGYKIDKEKGILVIEETEAELVRLIFDKYVNTPNMGYNGVAKWLNEHGYQKQIRQNSTYSRPSASFVKGVLDNPVYTGKIAYGRRKAEKIDGTRNEYHIVKQDEYNQYDGKHEAIISEETWRLAREKRIKNAFKREKRYSLEHAHILSGVVKCPVCGAPMYGVVNRKKKKDGSGEFYTDMWYYICSNVKRTNGKACTFRKHLRQDGIDAQVREVVQEALRNMDFTNLVKSTIGTLDNMDALQTERENLESAKKKAERQKSKLLKKIMALDADDDLYDAMYEDLQSLLREHTKNISELDAQINQISISIQNAGSQAATAEDVYQIMRAAIEYIDLMPDEDERTIMQSMLESVQVFPERQPNGLLVKSVRFKVPLNYNGVRFQDVELVGNDDNGDFLPNESNVETVVLLSKLNTKQHIEVDLDLGEMDLTAAESKATYDEIKAYVKEQTGLSVSSLYIAQVKEKLGIKERKCYNKAKSKDMKQLKCPPEKEKAIRDALAHFEMIQ